MQVFTASKLWQKKKQEPEMSQLEKCWEQEWVGIRKTETFSLATGNRPVWATFSHTSIYVSYLLYLSPPPLAPPCVEKTDQSSVRY